MRGSFLERRRAPRRPELSGGWLGRTLETLEESISGTAQLHTHTDTPIYTYVHSATDGEATGRILHIQLIKPLENTNTRLCGKFGWTLDAHIYILYITLNNGGEALFGIETASRGLYGPGESRARVAEKRLKIFNEGAVPHRERQEMLIRKFTPARMEAT